MKNFAPILLLLLSLPLFGQDKQSLTGIILDSVTHSPVELATITIRDSAGTIEKSTLTDVRGVFVLNDLKTREFTVVISCMGYQIKTVQITREKPWRQSALDLGQILLFANNKQLREVSVTANRPVIRREIDRLSYDVQADPDNKVQSILELMSKVPMLSVDGDENVRLKGSGNYRIFINGRPSALVAHNPKEALKAMPANSVQRIEVITTPPAKYDAEGLAGIINIVMNKKLVDGYNASVGTSYNNMVGMSENASLTGKKGKFGIIGRAYMYQDFKRFLQTENYRKDFEPNLSTLSQKGIYSYKGRYSSENLEISYEKDSLNLLTASASLFQSHYDDRTVQKSALYNQQNQLIQAYHILNTNPQEETGIDLNINYQLGFKDRKDQLLTFSYQFQHFPNMQHDDVLIDQQLNYAQNSYIQSNRNGTTEHTAQIDFVRPSKLFIVDGGVKAIFRNNFSDFSTLELDPLSGNYLADNESANQFNYRQNVYSLYNSWHIKLKPIEIKAGFRLEHTRIDANFISRNSLLADYYTNYIPVIALQRKLGKGAINFGYTQRILRPGIYQLNPFVDRSNPQFINQGNPDLNAVLNNNFELSYNAFGKGSYNLALSYSFANNSIQRITTLVDTSSVTTYQNIGKNKTVGLNASISYPFAKALSININSELSYIWLKGVYIGSFYTNSGLQSTAYSTLTYKISSTWRASTSVSLISPTILLQGRVNGYVFHSYRLSKALFNKKLSVSAAANNPYKKFRYVTTETKTPDFQQMVTNQRNYRMFTLSLNYNFGDTNSEIKKNQRKINNDDISGKDKK